MAAAAAEEISMKMHTDIVAEYYDAFNRRDTEVYARLFTPDCEIVAPGVQLRGIDAMRQFDAGWSQPFAEGRIESLRMTETDGAVVSGNWFHGGTHVQPLQTPAGTIPASGRNFQAPYCAMFEFEGDRIKTQRIVFDPDFVPRALGGR
jgi:ketosteroid isomerase-like protein